MAVFEDTPRDEKARQLTKKTFPSKQLQRDEFSLARLSHTDRLAFEKNIVGTRKLVGVACAPAAKLFDLLYVSQGPAPWTGRAVCLTDVVSERDHDGHAALGWSESQNGMGETVRGRVREIIKNNLAEIFGTYGGVEEVAWAVGERDCPPAEPGA